MREGGPYQDRHEAGRILAERVRNDPEIDPADVVVLALPRGGVPIGLEISRAIGAPLDVIVVRKLGVPGHPEVAMGAIASGGFEVLNERLIAEAGITRFEIAAVADWEIAELHRREREYRSNRAAVNVRDRTVLLVDDGLATGFTMRAAIRALRASGARQVAVAVPVGARETCEEIAEVVDHVVCPLQPELFRAVGVWYRDFTPTTDDEVRDCLAAAEENLHAHSRDHP